MALPIEHLPKLSVIEGGRDWRIDEAHIEAIAFMDEVEVAVALIVDQITGLPVPSIRAINEAHRLAHRAQLARAEMLALGPKDAA